MKLTATHALFGLLLLLSSRQVHAQAPPKPERPAHEMEQLLHKALVSQLPKVYEDRSAWGQTIPIPDRLLLPRLRRNVIPMEGRSAVPDGLWRKTRLSVDDPARDMRLSVREFKAREAKTYVMSLETDAVVRAESDVQQWLRGLLMVSLTIPAEVHLHVDTVVEVSTRLDTSRLPPTLSLEPKIKDLKLSLRRFEPKRVTLQRLGLSVTGDVVERAGEEFRGALEGRLRSMEEGARKHMEETLVRSLKEKKGPLTPAALLKAAAPLLASSDSRPFPP